MVRFLAFALSQRAFEKRQDFLPPVDRLLLTIRRAIVIEEPVSGAVVAMELVRLAELLQLGLVLVDLLGRRRLVVVAEEPQDRRGASLGGVDRRDGLARRQLFLRHCPASAPAVDA